VRKGKGKKKRAKNLGTRTGKKGGKRPRLQGSLRRKRKKKRKKKPGITKGKQKKREAGGWRAGCWGNKRKSEVIRPPNDHPQKKKALARGKKKGNRGPKPVSSAEKPPRKESSFFSRGRAQPKKSKKREARTVQRSCSL